MAGKQKRRKTKHSNRLLPERFKSWLTTLAVVCFCIFTLLVAGYVIFFRTVLAAEVKQHKQQKQYSIIFEEPFSPVSPIITEIVKKEAKAQQGRPLVAIIIDDMGHDRELGQKFLALDMDLSFSFLPFAPFTRLLEDMAYKAGRTILLHLPLQPRGKEWNPGPGALYLGEEPSKVRERFEKSLENVPHAIGVNNHMGSLYTENREAMANLLALIKEKELFYVDSFTSSKSVGNLLAKEMGVKSARRHVFLDNFLEVAKVCGQLDRLVTVAEKQGFAIGIGHPNKETLQALSSCMAQLTSKIQLVELTKLLR